MNLESLEAKAYFSQVIAMLIATKITFRLTNPKASLKNAFTKAQRWQVKFIVIIGNNEVETKTITFKNQTSGKQVTIDQRQIPAFLNQNFR